MNNSKTGQVIEQLLVEAVREHNVLPLTGRCNLSCIFCSHRHNPPGTAAYSFSPLSETKWSELLQFLNPSRKIIIGESATRLREGEPFTHPDLLNVLQRLRHRYPDTTLQVTTNGSLLNRETVRLLHIFKPLELVLSLNSATVQGRLLLMGDSSSSAALLPQLLAARDIDFHGSIVALPHLVGFTDLEQTIRMLDQSGAKTIRLLIPGYTRYSSGQVIPPTEAEKDLHNFALALKKSLHAVLLTEPPLIDNLLPVVEGLLPDSPASRAGIICGDLVDSVNNSKPRSRVEAFRMIEAAPAVELKLIRDAVRVELSLNRPAGQPAGLVFNYDLDPAQVDRVKSRLQTGRKTLMLVSEPALKRWETAARVFGLEQLTLVPVPSLFFGGSINSAGLLTVKDFQAALTQRLTGTEEYQTVLLPAIAFDQRGCDLRGEHYLALRTGQAALHLIG